MQPKAIRARKQPNRSRFFVFFLGCVVVMLPACSRHEWGLVPGAGGIQAIGSDIPLMSVGDVVVTNDSTSGFAMNQNTVRINNVVVSHKDTFVKGSGTLTTEQRPLKNVSSVKITAPVDVQIEYSRSPHLSIHTDDNILPLVKTEYDDGVFLISMTGGFSTDHGVKVTMGIDQLAKLIVKGSADVSVDNALSRKAHLQLSGASDISVTGEVDQLKIDSSGATNLTATDLKAKDIELVVSGSGDVQVYASRSVDVAVSGMGDVTIYGNPAKRKTEVTGMGEVDFDDD